MLCGDQRQPRMNRKSRRKTPGGKLVWNQARGVCEHARHWSEPARLPPAWRPSSSAAPALSRLHTAVLPVLALPQHQSHKPCQVSLNLPSPVPSAHPHGSFLVPDPLQPGCLAFALPSGNHVVERERWLGGCVASTWPWGDSDKLASMLPTFPVTQGLRLWCHSLRQRGHHEFSFEHRGPEMPSSHHKRDIRKQTDIR